MSEQSFSPQKLKMDVQINPSIQSPSIDPKLQTGEFPHFSEPKENKNYPNIPFSGEVRSPQFAKQVTEQPPENLENENVPIKIQYNQQKSASQSIKYEPDLAMSLTRGIMHPNEKYKSLKTYVFPMTSFPISNLISNENNSKAINMINANSNANENSVKSRIYSPMISERIPEISKLSTNNPRLTQNVREGPNNGNISAKLQRDESPSSAYERIEEIKKNDNHLIESSKEIDLKSKQKLIEWLIDIRLIKSNSVSIDEFHSYCRNGVLLADLINRTNVVINKIERKSFKRNK